VSGEPDQKQGRETTSGLLSLHLTLQELAKEPVAISLMLMLMGSATSL